MICTELCGLGHAVMRSWAIVMEPAAFKKWLAAGEEGNLRPGRRPRSLQQQRLRQLSHLQAGRRERKGRPDLDDLAASAKKAGVPLDQFVRESIVDPNKYIAPGYSPNVMPKTFGSLPKSQLDAVVSYLVSGGKKS